MTGSPPVAGPPGEVDRATVAQALALLGLSTEDVRGVQITPRWISARYLLRDPSRELAHGVVELVLEIPIRG